LVNLLPLVLERQESANLEVMAELMVATVRAQVMLSMFNDFENFKTFKPKPEREAEVHRMLDELVAWGRALKPVRSQPRVELAAARA
jgi:hypothetical protein